MARSVTPFATAGAALASATAGLTPDNPTKDLTMTKQRRGFAAMGLEKRREIARKGGSSVAPENRAYSRDRDLAVVAGRKGGEASRGGGRKAATS